MPEEPVAGRPYMPGYGIPETLDGILTWSWARRSLESSHSYWLATVYPAGRPHVMPIWGVWIEGQLYFSTGVDTRKAKNLRANPHCTVTVEDPTQPVVVEGIASIVTDIEERWRICGPYTAKYNLPLRPTDDGVTDPDGNGGPLFAVRPVTVFGMREEAPQTATRWSFDWKTKRAPEDVR